MYIRRCQFRRRSSTSGVQLTTFLLPSLGPLLASVPHLLAPAFTLEGRTIKWSAPELFTGPLRDCYQSHYDPGHQLRFLTGTCRTGARDEIYKVLQLHEPSVRGRESSAFEPPYDLGRR